MKKTDFRLMDGKVNSYRLVHSHGGVVAVIRGSKPHTVPGQPMWTVRPLLGRSKVSGLLYRGLTLGTAIDTAIFTYWKGA